MPTLPSTSISASAAPAGGQRVSLRDAFRSANEQKRLALVPFVPGGFPDLQTTTAVITAAAAGGATAIEVGFPFSDPIADGPTIQEAFTAALAKKIRVADVFGAVAAARHAVAAPMLGMLSYSIVFRYGVERFVADAKAAGLDGLILPDLPPPEAAAVCDVVRAGGLETVLLVAPTTASARRRQITELSSGFVYYLSVSGITGARDQLPADLARNVRELKELTDRPVCVGFGISQPRHLAELKGVADGAIVGSALVKRMQAHQHEGSAAIAEAVRQFVEHLLG